MTPEWYQKIEELISQLERITHPMAGDEDLEDAKNLIAKYREELSPFCGLDTRAMNCLLNGGLETKGQIREAFLAGKIKPKFRRNYGPKTHARVAEWLNLPASK